MLVEKFSGILGIVDLRWPRPSQEKIDEEERPFADIIKSYGSLNFNELSELVSRHHSGDLSDDLTDKLRNRSSNIDHLLSGTARQAALGRPLPAAMAVLVPPSVQRVSYADWHARLLSWWELRRSARRGFGPSTRIVLPLVSAYGQPARLDRWIRRIDAVPVVRDLALPIFPAHLLLAQKTLRGGRDGPPRASTSRAGRS